MCLRIICSRAVRAVLFPFRVFGQEGFGLRGFCSWALAIRRAPFPRYDLRYRLRYIKP